jgi:hypothetical protein
LLVVRQADEIARLTAAQQTVYPRTYDESSRDSTL